jgi:hypothetical protein
MALRTELGSLREAARDVRSASEFKEPLEEIDSVNLFSSSFIYESSCSLILFRAIELQRRKTGYGIPGPEGWKDIM